MEEKRFNRLLERYKYSPEAVKELYEYYYPIIVRYINRQFRGEVDGQDVAQQFFLKLFQMKSYKIRTPNAWVRTVTKNIAIDILRKNGKQYRVKELLVLPDYTGPPDNVADILKVLSESEQQIMYLRYWEKYNLKEIAELIKMKYSSVKYIHRAAKKKLRKAYIKAKVNGSNGAIGEIDEEMAVLSKQNSSYSDLFLKGVIDDVLYFEKTDRLKSRMSELRERRLKLVNEDEEEKCLERLRGVKRVLDKHEFLVKFDESLFDEIVDKIYIEQDGSLIFALKCELKLKIERKGCNYGK